MKRTGTSVASIRSVCGVGAAIALAATAFLSGCATHDRAMIAPVRHVAARPVTSTSSDLAPSARLQALPVPSALEGPAVGLRDGPSLVPLTLQIPSIGADLTVLGVGITTKNVMDAPEGGPDAPVWQQAFWYRGSAIPGAISTALIAAHIDDPLGRPGAFAHIDRLRRGDTIVVHDTRTGLDVRFEVTVSKAYPVAEWTDPAVLTGIYGAGPVAGTWPQRSPDGLAHLTLITCAGTFRNAIGTHDERLAVFATRVA